MNISIIIRLLSAIFFIFLIVGCNGDIQVTDPTIQKEYTYETTEDPNAPKIPQIWIDWIRKNGNPINNLSSENFYDLQFLKPILANKKIIQLGESSHTTSEYSSAKVRLIKFLHKEMGFNVIAIESPIFECFNAYVTFNKSSDIMKESIFSVWWTKEVLELFNYISETRNTSSPLILAGFDIHRTFSEFKADFLKSFFSRIDVNYGRQIYELENKALYGQIHSGNKDSVINAYENLLSRIEINWNLLEKEFANNLTALMIAKRTIISEIENLKMTFSGSAEMQSTIRDKAMAENLIYLSNEVYKGQKIIIWAHNGHIMHNYASLKTAWGMPKIKNMGYYISQTFQNMVYTIGFYMYRGSYFLDYSGSRIVSVKPSGSDNIEAIFYHARKKYLFLNIENQINSESNSWLFKEMKAKHHGLSDEVFIPEKQFSGIFYIDEIHPPNYIK
ncbi:MAG: erythromycin esterase family protein [Melioribacteraceae bacterium]|nr:erythromycin esterase family protein [Melioribacteraceae bacterium]